jgi:hypothetical protein
MHGMLFSYGYGFSDEGMVTGFLGLYNNGKSAFFLAFFLSWRCCYHDGYGVVDKIRNRTIQIPTSMLSSSFPNLLSPHYRF